MKQRVFFLGAGLAHLFLAGALYAILLDHAGLPASLSMVAAGVVAGALLWSSWRRYLRTTHGIEDRDQRLSLLLGLFIEFVVLLKLLYLGLPDLLPEEAYYWQYALHPALGYVDHPPMVAWGILGGTALFGDNEFGIRILFFVCSLLGAWFLGLLARDCWGRLVGKAAFLLTLLLPYPFLFSIYATPDSPLIACWAAGLFFVHRALLTDRSWAWLGFGICLGLGTMSKYTMALLGPAVLLYMLIDRESRRWFLRPEPWLALVLCFIVMSPNLWWNYENDWSSILYQTQRRLAEIDVFHLHRVLLAALILITPLGVLGVLTAIRHKSHWVRDAAGDEHLAGRRRLLFGLVWLIGFGLFAAFSIRVRSKMNWTGPGWLTMVPVLTAQWIHRPGLLLGGVPGLAARHWTALLLFLTIGYAAGFQYLTLGIPGVPYRQESVKPVSWEEFGSLVQGMVEDLRAENGQDVYVVGCNRFTIASELAFYRQDGMRGVRTTCSENFYGGNGGMFRTWFEPPSSPGINVLFVSFKLDRIQDQRIVTQSRDLSDVQVAQVHKRGKAAGRFYYRTARGFVRKP